MSIRPSQLVGVFGPGAIYDSLSDSMLILGIDCWNEDGFERIDDPYLLDHIKREAEGYLNRLRYFLVISSPSKESSVPVVSFPTWGVCNECHMLQRRRGSSGEEFYCRSHQCSRGRRGGNTNPTQTVPVRFISACKSGHMDDFPFYEWVHTKQTEREWCPEKDALLYLKNGKIQSPSLVSKVVECRKCGLERSMEWALTKNGISYITKKPCSGRMPWLDTHRRESCEMTQAGMLKGSSNVYFPVAKSAITIPPFSDGLSREIMNKLDFLNKSSTKSYFTKLLEDQFDVKTGDNPNGRYSVGDVLEKYRLISNTSTDGDRSIFELEFDQLNGGVPIDDKEFRMRPVEKLKVYGGHVDRVAQVEKLRQVVTITGFTRIHPLGDPESDAKIVPISSGSPEWLPAVENRGEGIFLSLNQTKITDWEQSYAVQKILNNSGGPRLRTPEGKAVDARYVLLHTLSHMLIRSLSDMSGYHESSMQERIYSSENMAGILIFTSSPSSDGSLGGLSEQGRNFNQVLRWAVDRSKSCSSDPLCSLRESGEAAPAACHTCTLLPEPACESMNRFLDRRAVHSTIGHSGGFFYE